MTKGRIEAFSDGVLAIIITIMVLELKVPQGDSWDSLKPLIPKFLSYIFSFIYVGIYWNNHHHLFQTLSKINGKIMWANLHLLFWLSLTPVTTYWIGETEFASVPVAVYGIVLVMNAIAYNILENVAISNEGDESLLKEAMQNRWKEYVSLVFYASGIAASFFYPIAGIALYYIVAVLWLIPDLRIEKSFKDN